MTQLSTKQIGVIGAAALVLGLFFDYLLYDKQPGIAFVIYIALLLAAFYLLVNQFKLEFNRQNLFYILPILFFSGMVAMTDNEFLIFWNVVLSFGLLLLFANQNLGQSVKNYKLFDYAKTAVLLPIKFIAKAMDSLGQLLAIKSAFKNRQHAAQITKGILITLPILFFFLILLSSADLVFEKFLSNLFNFNLNFESADRFWFVLVVTFVWLGVYAYILENIVPRANNLPEEAPSKYVFGKIEAGILFTTLNVLFLAFVIIQIKYLFAGQEAVTRLGFTYAEYAHKGFFELNAVAIFVFALIFAVEKYIDKTQAKSLNVFKFLGSLLILQTMVIMASAFLRLSVYEEAYGFTFLRILVQAFIIWLGVIFLILWYKIFTSLKETTFVFALLVSVLAFFAILNILNPDAFVARKNIERFAKENKLDTQHLADLSADAVPEIVKLFDYQGYTNKNANTPLPQVAATILVNMRDRIEPGGPEAKKPWQSYNISRDRALELINQHITTIIQYQEAQ